MDRAELLRFELARTRSCSGALRAVEERICRGAGKALPPVSLAVSDVADSQASVEFTVLRSVSLYHYSQAIKFSAGTTFVPTTYGVEAVRAWIRDHGLLCAPVDAVRDSSAAEGAIPSPATSSEGPTGGCATAKSAADHPEAGLEQSRPSATEGVGTPAPSGCAEPEEEIEYDGRRWRLASGFRGKGSRKIGNAFYVPAEAQ